MDLSGPTAEHRGTSQPETLYRKNVMARGKARSVLGFSAIALFAACGGGEVHAPLPPVHGSNAPAPGAPPTSPVLATRAVAEGKDDARVEEAAKKYLAELERHSPESMTSLGVHTRDHLLDDRTEAGLAADVKWRADLLSELVRGAATWKLGTRARTDLAVLRGSLERDVVWADTIDPGHRKPNFYTEPLSALFLMVSRDYAPAKVRAERVVDRLKAIPAMLAQAQVNLKAPPKVWTEIGIESAKGADSFLKSLEPFLHASLPKPHTEADGALREARRAFASYRTFLERVVLPRSVAEFAIGRKPFDLMLAADYHLHENADEVHAIGEAVFAKTEKELEEASKRVDKELRGPTPGDWAFVLKKLKGRHPKAADLIDAYKKEVERARKFLVEKDAVPFPEGDVCDVQETPEFLRSTTTAAYDRPPPFDASTVGIFFVTPVDKSLPPAKQEEMLRENDFGDIVDTAVHEAYPGHHLQLSFARRHPSTIRKVIDSSILSEGWALYSEELMNELGYYTPEERMLELEWALVRAARVLIDVGMHTRGMTPAEAERMLVDRVHLEPTLARSEVRRYTESPTQPLSYMVGREMIFRLRERYRKGGKSLKDFHRELLSRGTISPVLIEEEIFAP